MSDYRCMYCIDFITSIDAQMKRHVAIVHGKGTFSTLLCFICQQKFYDFDHFQEHIRESPGCLTECLKVTTEDLEPGLEVAFLSLVSQMMVPLNGQAHLNQGEQQVHMKQQVGIGPKIVSVTSLANRHQMDNGTHEVSRQIPNGGSNFEKSNRGGNRRRSNNAFTELLNCCEQIISRRQYNGRIACILCTGSLASAYKNRIMIRNVVDHACRHLGISLSLASGHIDRIKEMFNQCFDHDARVKEGLKRGHQVAQPNIRKDRKIFQTTQASDGFHLNKRARIRKQPIGQTSTNQKAIQEVPTFGRQKAVKKLNRIVRSKVVRRKLDNGSFRGQQYLQFEKVKRFIIKGRLQCKLCPQSIAVGQSTGLNILPAFRHASMHQDLQPFKCCKCSFTARADTVMHAHTRKCHQGGANNFIDNSSQYSQEIFKNFLACYSLDGNEVQASTSRTEHLMPDVSLNRDPDVDASTSTTELYHCDRCIYKSAFQKLFALHMKIMHKE